MTDARDGRLPVRRALLSVYDKTGIVELARALAEAGAELLSTGGTRRALMEAGLAVTEVSEHTGFPEMMDGRVKTLHPRIHGGLLGRRSVDAAVMAEHDIAPIDLVVGNLYPFRETVARDGATAAEIIEEIDIGGPAMLRSAAKNHADVAVLVDSADFPAMIEAVAAGGTTLEQRRALAARAFRHTAAYDAAVSAWFSRDEGYPERVSLSWEHRETLRYGENPHQQAALYVDNPVGTAAGAQLLQGKAMSFCNVADADSALECARTFAAPTCVIVKHANPCGVGSADNLITAYDRAFACDPTSAFGGIIAFNRPLDADTAAVIAERQLVDVVIAPGVEPGAGEALARRRNARLLDAGTETPAAAPRWQIKQLAGGVLLQSLDDLELDETQLRVVTRRAPTESEMADLRFAWRVAWWVKSNAIVYARDGQTIGIGAGQMARVTSAQIAGMKAADAGLDIRGTAMASDAFFPFRDSIDSAAASGVRAIIQPGGSMRDDEVIAAADEHDVAMLFTGIRHFRH